MSVEADGSAKKRQGISLKLKINIIKRLERGEKMSDLALMLNIHRSTVSTIVKKFKKISWYK